MFKRLRLWLIKKLHAVDNTDAEKLFNENTRLIVENKQLLDKIDKLTNEIKKLTSPTAQMEIKQVHRDIVTIVAENNISDFALHLLPDTSGFDTEATIHCELQNKLFKELDNGGFIHYTKTFDVVNLNHKYIAEIAVAK